jgi:DNA polymerase
MPHQHNNIEAILQLHPEMLEDTYQQVIGSALGQGPEAEIKALRDPALRCCRCDLCIGRTQVVFGEGSPNAKLMIVGEAPGADEDKSGHPFWGRAGQMFNSLLETAGLAREDVWVTNTVKCRPTKGEVGRLSNRPPLAPEINACNIWRTGELSILKPRIVCCLGAVAAKAIMGRPVKMTVERGQWFAFPLSIDGMEKSEVMVTYHPSYIMRQQGEAYDRIRAQADADFASIADKLRG